MCLLSESLYIIICDVTCTIYGCEQLGTCKYCSWSYLWATYSSGKLQVVAGRVCPFSLAQDPVQSMI